MATEGTVDLSETHEPKQASIEAFQSILDTLKQELQKLRHDHDSKHAEASPFTSCTIADTTLFQQLTKCIEPEHEPEYFKKVSSLSDDDLTSFAIPDHLLLVRVGTSAYGLHLLGKVQIPALEDAYIHVRVFIGSEQSGGDHEERVASLHSIHTEEIIKDDGDRVYRAIFNSGNPLEWFET